jgi:ferredoxin
VDERDIMFARARLRPGTAEYRSYYERHPESRAGDDRTRSLPGLLAAEAELAEPRAFATAAACFELTETMREAVDGPVAATPELVDPAELTALVRGLALRWGAVDVGVARLEPYHVYTHVGRGTGGWGSPISLEHDRAIAFTVEMDHRAMAWAPRAPVVQESARQYVEAGRIAIQLAAVLRRLGHPARAHVDGNYRVVAPLVGRDAGLGEIGRMGLLMTPGLGPRVRLGVVTTTAPLEVSGRVDDPSVLDFCAVCRKCAANCPTASIPSGDRTPVGEDGLRWRIDAETCYRYWCAIGTDCGRCMAVCPYSHPDSPAHNLIRWATRRSGAARRAVLWLDDVFYGRRPTRGGF